MDENIFVYAEFIILQWLCLHFFRSSREVIDTRLMTAHIQTRSAVDCPVVENSDGQLTCGGAGAVGGSPRAAGEEAVRSFYEEEEATERAVSSAAAAAAESRGEL